MRFTSDNPELWDNVERREEVFVGLSDYGGTEGPVAVVSVAGEAEPMMVMPLFTTKPQSLEKIREGARRAAVAEKRTVVVARFTQREDLVAYGPDGQEVPLDVQH